jgi:hypothetical protein
MDMKLSFKRIIIIGLAAVLGLSGCWLNNNTAAGQLSKIHFKSVASYRQTSGLVGEKLGVNCPIILKMTEFGPKGGGLITGVDVSVTPADAAEVTKVASGQVVVTALKAARFDLEVRRNGKLLDVLSLKAADVASITFEKQELMTWSGSKWRKQVPDFEQNISLGTNQTLRFTLVPRDAEGNALMGGLDPLFVPSEESDLNITLSTPSSIGFANRVKVTVDDDMASNIDLDIIETNSDSTKTVHLALTGHVKIN